MNHKYAVEAKVNLKDALIGLIEEFKLGKKDLDITYKFTTGGKIEVTNFSFHDPWTWDNEKEPAYISFNSSKKSISVSSLSYTELNDPTISVFLALPEEFGDI